MFITICVSTLSLNLYTRDMILSISHELNYDKLLYYNITYLYKFME